MLYFRLFHKCILAIIINKNIYFHLVSIYFGPAVQVVDWLDAVLTVVISKSSTVFSEV